VEEITFTVAPTLNAADDPLRVKPPSDRVKFVAPDSPFITINPMPDFSKLGLLRVVDAEVSA
jgi:hypothetical protein